MPPSTRTIFKSPSAAEKEACPDSKLRHFVNSKRGLNLRDYWELQEWSTNKPNDFWVDMWEFSGIIGTREDLLFDASYPMDKPNPDLIRAHLNFAENMLLSHSLARSSSPAILSIVEPDPTLASNPTKYLDSTFLRSLTFEELYQQVRILAHALKGMGVKAGDRVAAFSPSNAEAIILVLAVASIGGVWSSTPCEFGTRAVLERFSQIEPVVLLTADSYRYGGKTHPVYPKLLTILEDLPSVKNVIVVGHLFKDRQPREPFPSVGERRGRTWETWEEVVKHGQGAPREIDFWRGPAMAPLYILYSSGTTGKPKAIVHTVGGMVLSSKMANHIHNALVPGDSFLQFSTLGWMMWNYAISTLAIGVQVVCYDGSPLNPLPILWQLVDKYNISVLGISPRYLQTLDNAKYLPNKHHKLERLKSIGIAGSVLKAELYDWMRDNVKKDLYINNGSGGTDICNLFVGGVSSLPIYYAEIQAPGLGMKVEAWDDDGKPVLDGQGNMVITRPFPNMPLGFWGDTDGKRYKSAYYEEYPKTPVWYHADWIEISSVTGGVTIFGRSDGVLNPGGVRFGSAELYAVVEEMKDIIEDCIAVGQKLPDGDERVILFVKPLKGELTEDIRHQIKKGILKHLSTRHVPAKIIALEKIPYTTNGKRLEVATKKLVNGIAWDKVNLSSAEDAECLKVFINHPELRLDQAKAKL